jgi:hypothetical protein
MKEILLAAVMLSLGCTGLHSRTPAPSTIPISVRSYNHYNVDVYLLCGESDAQWLGSIKAKDNRAFEIPASRARCALGLNFFLVSRKQKRGYWVGPLFPRAGYSIDLIIERYAGLSTAAIYED